MAVKGSVKKTSEEKAAANSTGCPERKGCPGFPAPSPVCLTTHMPPQVGRLLVCHTVSDGPWHHGRAQLVPVRTQRWQAEEPLSGHSHRGCGGKIREDREGLRTTGNVCSLNTAVNITRINNPFRKVHRVYSRFRSDTCSAELQRLLKHWWFP